MPTVPPVVRAAAGVLAGFAVSAVVVMVVSAAIVTRPARHRLVPEDASGHLRRVAIHYTPAMDARTMPVWRALFTALPTDIEIVVAVPTARDFDRFTAGLAAAGVPALTRFRPVVVDQPLTTWSRDRMAALEGGAVLAPPKVATATGGRAGDWAAPFAIARDIYGGQPALASFVFEGGDLAASRRFVFADANLIGRNLGRGDATRAHLEAALGRTFAQDIVWLGDAAGDVPEHHIMMYAVPLDDQRVLVGDVALGQRLLAAETVRSGATVPVDADVAGHARRFDHVAALLTARGFAVSRIPVVVLPGAGSYVTYTNALFDRDARGPVVYLPTYRLPALDDDAAARYRALGYRVVPIDVTSVYQLNGSLGCLVNVMARTRP